MSLYNKLALILFIIFSIFMFIFYILLERYSFKEAESRIMNVLTQYQAIQHFNKTVQKPQIYKLQKDKQLKKDYFEASLMSSSYISSHIAIEHQKLLEKKGLSTEIKLKFASNNPTNLINKASDYEKEVLAKMQNGKITSFMEVMQKDGEEQLFYALSATRNTNKCLRCHGDPKDAPADMIKKYGDQNGYFEKEGELRAIIALYAPLDIQNDNKDMFFYFVVALLLTTFLAIFILMRFYNKKLLEKDTMLMEQSHFASMGELSSMLVTRWKQPLSLISSRITNLILDVEMDMVEPKLYLKNLEAVSSETQKLSSSIDYFKHFFTPDRHKTCVDLNTVIEEVFIILSKEIKDHHISVNKEYSSLIKSELSAPICMLVLTQVLKNIIEKVKGENTSLLLTTKQHTKSIEVLIKVNEKEVLPLNLKDEFDLSKVEDKEMGLYMAVMLIKNQLSADIKFTTEGGSSIVSIVIPLFSCEEV